MHFHAHFPFSLLWLFLPSSFAFLLLFFPSSLAVSLVVFCSFSLEGIADGEVVGYSMAETLEIVETVALGVVGGMEAHTDIEAEDEETEIIADACSGAESDASEVVSGKFGIGTQFVLMEKPHITCVKEDGAMEMAEEACTKLCIGLEFEVARLIYIGILRIGGSVASRSCCAYGKGADAVGSTDVELFGIGCRLS